MLSSDSAGLLPPAALMGKKNRQSVDGAQRKAAASTAAAQPPQQPAAPAPAQGAAETAPLHQISRVTGVDLSGLPRDELLITVHLPTVQSEQLRAGVGVRASPAHACFATQTQARATCVT